MKRSFQLKAEGLTVTAVVDSAGKGLTKDEVQNVVDRLKDGCIRAMCDAPYVGPQFAHQVKVSR